MEEETSLMEFCNHLINFTCGNLADTFYLLKDDADDVTGNVRDSM